MPRFRVTADAFARLIAAVAERPRSYSAIAEETGLHVRTVAEYIKALYHHRQVHIGGWEPDSRGQYRIKKWLLGPGPDVPAPVLTAYQRQVGRRARLYAAAGKPPPKNVRKAKRIINSVFALGENIK